MRNIPKIAAAVFLALNLGACATWNSMSPQQRSMAIGAGVGGVLGASVSEGGILSTVGGAAIGGVIGNEVGKTRR